MRRRTSWPSEKALYRGHAVAAVAATDPHIAEDALDLIEVEYEVLPPVLDVREAMAEGAPSCTTTCDHATQRRSRPQPPDKPTQHRRAPAVQARRRREGLRRGRRRHRARVHDHDVPPGLHRAAQRHRLLEPRRPPDGLDQQPGALRRGRNLWPSSCRLPRPRSPSCRWRSAAASAARSVMYLEPLAALLSKKTGKPVKMTMTRDEVFEATGPTSGTLHPRQDRRQEGRHADRRRGLPGLRGRRLPRLARRRRHERHLRALRHPQLRHRWL